MQQTENLKQFQREIIPEIVQIIMKKEPVMFDNTRHKIRRYSLEILLMTPFPDQRDVPTFDQIIKMIIQVLEKDNEENAELALKILIELQKFYKTNWDTLENIYSDFLSYCEKLYLNLPKKLDQVRFVDESAVQPQRNQPQEEQTLTPSINSIKTISLCNHYFLLLNSLFDDKHKTNIQTLVKFILDALDKFPDKILNEVKNMPLYMEYLDMMKNILSFFSFIFKKNFTYEVIDNLGKLLSAQIKILKNTPQHGIQIRKDILHMVKYEINEIFNLEKIDKQARHQEQVYMRKNEALSAHINDFINMNIMFGKGKLNKELQFHTKSLVFTFISQQKEPMTEEQLKKSLQIIIKSILDPTVTLSMKNTLIYMLYRKHEELQSKQNSRTCQLQLEILESLIQMFKDLDSQLQVAVDELANFKQEVINQRQNNVKWMNDQEQKNANHKDLYFQEDYQFIEIGNNQQVDLEKVTLQYFFYHLFETQFSQTGSQYTDITKIKNKYQGFISLTDSQLNDYIEQQKEICLKLVKNLISFIDTIIYQNITEFRQSKFFQLTEMKLMRKLLIHGSRVIQHLYDLFQNDKDKVHEILKRFAKVFQQMKTLQFRDLFQSVEDEFFGMVIEVKATKGDTGIYYLADYLMSFQNAQQGGGQNMNQPNPLLKHQDDQVAYLLEIFFEYINKKMKIFNKAMENEKILTTNKMDQKFASLPTPDLQDTLQKLTLAIGDKALSKKNDLRMKNLFFSIFIFCIKYTKASQIVPYYFAVIRNLFKVLCNLSDNSNFVKEFIPMIQGLLETFLQAKEEAAFIKETNEICYSVPAKLKNLIEYLPIISRPLIDSMKSNSIELIESGINSIQMWVSALASYPEILDPVIANILPELNSLLYKILYLLPNYTFKLLGKLGAKSRLYYEDKEFKSKNLQDSLTLNFYSPEDGLKIDLIDQNSGKQIVLGIDSAIDVVLLKIFDSYHKYNHQKLLEAYKLVKSSFICFIEPDFDIDYLVASIVNAKTRNTDLLTNYSMNSTKYFDSKQQQIRISALGKGSESHAFEKILKCLLIACSLPKKNTETEVVHKKVKKFFKWVTQYFTLIYICKNGKLKENLVNEISPLVFIENICDFLYYNMLQGLPKMQQRSYFKGSVVALKTMIRMVKEIYGEDDIQIYENLEFLQILIQKICHLSYGQDLPKKVAANIALQIIIKELPERTIKFYWQSFIDSLFHILNTNNEQLIYIVERECKKTLQQFLEKVGLFSDRLFSSIDEKDQEFSAMVIDKMLQNVHQNKISSKNVAIFFIEMISKKSGYSVHQILNNVQCSYYNNMANQVQQQDKSWAFFLVNQQIEQKGKGIFNLFKGGYSQVMNLISYLDLLQFLLKHKIIEPLKKVHVYLAICEQLLKILEDEVEKSELKGDNLASFNNDMLISQAAKSAVKYMKLEKHYISQNKPYDSYSHTLYPHHFLQNQHFEVEELAKRDKQASELEAVKFSYQLFELFVPERFVNFDMLNPRATELLQSDEASHQKHLLQQRINDFIGKLFQPQIRASDISFDYVHHMYELFPNHRLHAELISKCLQILCDISTEESMHFYFKERTQAFFDAQGNPPGQAPNQPNMNIGQQVPQAQQSPQSQFLNRKLDLYAVEIKSKIIAVYFKFFQREEQIIYKSAKKCLKRILKKETNQQEALPNQILKECVRPSLNILSQRGSFPALYEQLTKLINVLHGCFNEQLGKHLIRCYENNKQRVTEKFQLNMYQEKYNLQNQQQQNNDGNGQTNAHGDVEMPQEPNSDKLRKFNEDYERLLFQQNQKIEDLEIANNIIKILYLLPTARADIYKILIVLPEFEVVVLSELESKFDETYQQLLEHYQQNQHYNHESSLRPLSMKLGILKSDFRVGLQKFYNKNPFESLDIFKQIGKLTPVMLDILKEPSSFCIRERLSREPEIIRGYLSCPADSIEFQCGMKMVQIFLKYNKNYLNYNHNWFIVEALRKQWYLLGMQDLNELMSGNFQIQNVQLQQPMQVLQNQYQLRNVYNKLQKALIAYCRSPKAKIQILFDLIKGYKYQAFIDMTQVKLFFLYEVPYNFPLKKKRDLLIQTLERFKSAQPGPLADELKFMIFEMAFMPSIIKHSASANEQQFKELVDENLMREFIDTFFGVSLVQLPNGPARIQHIEQLRQNLEISQTVSYEQFQIEIIKVINLMFRYFDYPSIQAACPQREVTKITQFLYQCAKKANNSILKEWAFYTLTSMFIKILDAQSYEIRMNLPPQAADEAMLNMIAQSSEQVLMMILQHSLNLQFKALVHKSFRNLISILNDPRIKDRIISNNQRDVDYVSLCLKRALIFEGRNTVSIIYLSSFILGHQDSFYYYHDQFLGRMHRIIQRFGAQLQPNLSQKQLLVELSAVVISWIQRRLQQHNQGRISEQLANSFQTIFTNILFYLIRTSVMVQFSQNEPIKEVLDLSNQCLRQIMNLVRVFSTDRIQFPYFNRLLQQESGDRENLQIIKIAILNVSYILIKHQRQTQEFKKFFLEYIVNANTKYQKGILFTCKILLHIIQTNQDQQFQLILNTKLRQFLMNDLQKCQDENVNDILQKIKINEDKYQIADKKPALLSFQESALMISNTIPHFAIRFINAYYQLLHDRQPSQANDLMDSFKISDNEFIFFKDLATAIFRVVGFFRRYIIFDQSDVAPQKLRYRHNVVFQPTNALTQYTPEKELLLMNDDIAELKVEEPNYDLFNKETIMMGIHLCVKRIKTMQQEEAMQILEIVQYTIQTLIKYNTNEYIIEQLRKIIDTLIEDEPGDVSRLLMEQKCAFVHKLLAKIPELQTPEKKDNPQTNVLVDAIFEQAVRFLEKQNSMLTEYTSRLFEKVFINLKGKNVALKQRVFKVFDKLNGSSLFKKLQYFFSKHQLEDNDKLAFFQSQSQLLDFTLYNFKSNVPLKKTKYSSRLFPLFNLQVRFDNIIIEDNPVTSEYNKVTTLLKGFSNQMNKIKKMELSSLMNPLSEIISINPSHSTDKLISDKLFIKLFWQYWNVINREEQQILSESINQFFVSTIPMINTPEFRKNSFPKTFLESVATLSPQIRLEPEILQFLGKNLNLWHVTIPILENHITLFPDNERYHFSLNELYTKLVEDDYIAGLRRLVTESPETRSIVSYGQHQMWEEINSQFSNFIIYYAEQEGLYQQMDKEYDIPGKYQRQLPHQTFMRLRESHKEALKKRKEQELGKPIDDWNIYKEEIEDEERKLDKSIDEIVRPQNRQGQDNPVKASLNKRIKEIDLRIWENLFIESLKVLNKWDQYRDIAHALNNQEMMIEYLWNVKDWRNLQSYEQVLKKSDSIKYQLYYIYLIIYQQQINQFDEVFKQVIQLSYKEWDQYLPNYVDNIQFENLIMFQLVMESSEGGRNMIKEAQALKVGGRGRLADMKTAINVWRERVPHLCENIQMWKEVLENRNFIQTQISHIICPVAIPQNTGQQNPQQQQEILIQQKAANEQRQQFVNEFLDVSWNYYKLALVSRKQGLPSLAYYYQSLLKSQTNFSGDSEGLKFERFKAEYEDIKLNLQFNNNSKSLQTAMDNYTYLIRNRYLENGSQIYEPWQTAELCRLMGEYHLKTGDLNQSQFFLTKSLENNKKEAKTWFSYAKLNQTVHEFRRTDQSLINALKGYLSSIVLNLPKSRLIIPQIFKLLKKKEIIPNNPQMMILFLKNNLDQMPTWIWIFWIPQLLHIIYAHQNNLELCLAIKTLEKLSKLYPQALYYPLKMKSWVFSDELPNASASSGAGQSQQQQIQNQVKQIVGFAQRASYQQIHYTDKISSEFFKNMKLTPEEELHIVLTKILCMSQFFKVENFETDFAVFLNQINEKFFRDDNLNQSQLMRELKPIFIKDFIDENTREKNSIDIIKRTKNLKDFLHRKLSLTEQKTNLELISPYLANFNEKGVELPGQFMVTDQEPVPLNTIYIQKFEPVVYRGGVTTKKIVIKGSNSKVYAFTINVIQNKDDYNKFCQEEKVLQVKMLMNQIFQSHKETLRRGVKFYVPMKVIMYRSKLSQDDLQFANLQEIHDYLFQERGLDSDLAFNLQIKKVEAIFDDYPQDQPKTINSLRVEQKKKINEDTYYEMKNIYCQPYLLSSFFHRIFYNVDDLFIFKKQFTIYHAVNSFFSYIFQQVDFSTLNQISFCKTSGRLNYNEAKLLEFLKNRVISQILMSNRFLQDIEQIEREEIQGTGIFNATGQTSALLPFRMTNNISEFIGRIGLNGLFAGVMTSCSLALTKHQEKLMPLIYLIYRDEIRDQKEQMNVMINNACSYIEHKFQSLSNNKNILDVSGDKDGQQNNEGQSNYDLEDFITIGQIKVPKVFLKYEIEKPILFEEFNKKVFDLIDIATDDKRLSQMPSNWNAWF